MGGVGGREGEMCIQEQKEREKVTEGYDKKEGGKEEGREEEKDVRREGEANSSQRAVFGVRKTKSDREWKDRVRRGGASRQPNAHVNRQSSILWMRLKKKERKKMRQISKRKGWSEKPARHLACRWSHSYYFCSFSSFGRVIVKGQERGPRSIVLLLPSLPLPRRLPRSHSLPLYCFFAASVVDGWRFKSKKEEEENGNP